MGCCRRHSHRDGGRGPPDRGLGDSVLIPIFAIHRLENEGVADAIIIEVQLGDQLDEDDIERLDDVYGRLR
jgi:mannose-6-phosphate isomerase